MGDAGEVESDWGGEENDASDTVNALRQTGTSVMKANYLDTDSNSSDRPSDPIIICIDNAHLMDSTSWRLFGEIAAEELHVAFYLIIKYDYRDRLLIVPEAKDAFDEAWNVITDTCGKVRLAELPNLSEEHVK